MIKLTVITINYNNIAGLKKTSQSIITQDWRDFEWILIDGGSTDGSREYISELAQSTNNNISYWCSEKDKGVYNAMNKGIAKSLGEYVIFMNSGDWFINESVLSEVFGTSRNSDVLYGYVERVLEGRQQRLLGFLHKSEIDMVDMYYQTIPHQGTFFKRSLFDKFGLYDESLKILADRKFYVQSIIYGNATVEFLPLSIAYFDEGGVSGSDFYYEEKERVLNELFPTRVYKVITEAKGVREIRNTPLMRIFYSLVYRMSSAINNKIRCRRK